MLLPEERAELEKNNPFSCYLCKYFYGGSWGSYYNPPEPPECVNDLACHCMNLPNWPFGNGCKHHSKREAS